MANVPLLNQSGCSPAKNSSSASAVTMDASSSQTSNSNSPESALERCAFACSGGWAESVFHEGVFPGSAAAHRGGGGQRGVPSEGDCHHVLREHALHLQALAPAC